MMSVYPVSVYPTSSYNFQRPHGRHGHDGCHDLDGRHGHSGHVDHDGHGHDDHTAYLVLYLIVC